MLSGWLSTGLKALTALWIAVFAVIQSAQACVVSVPMEIEDIRQADSVLVGTLERYERVSTDPGAYGLLTVRVDEVLKGDLGHEVQLYWWNSTFGVPESRGDEGQPLIIAAIGANSESLPPRSPAHASPRSEWLQVLQPPCSGAFIFPYTPESEQGIRMILRGESVASDTILTARPVTEVEGNPAPAVIVGAVGVPVALLVAGFMVYRRRRRRQAEAAPVIRTSKCPE